MSNPVFANRWMICVVASAAVMAIVAIASAQSTVPTTTPTTSPATMPLATVAEPAARPAGSGRSERRGRRERQSTVVSPPLPPPPLDAAAAPITPLPMAPAYAVVKFRSIFVKGNQAVGERGSGRGNVDPGPHAPTAPVRPEASIVFEGFMGVDDQRQALVENVSDHTASMVRVGDELATGRVVGVSFDTLDYQPKGGTVVHVSVGQTLEGKAAAPGENAAPGSARPADASSSAEGGAPTTAPARTLVNTAGLSTDDILTRMKKRREQEQAGGK